MTRAALALALLLCLCAVSQAADPPQVGSFSLTFTEKAPASDPVKITQRTGWLLSTIKNKIDINYDLATETFETYIPAKYDGDSPYGLIVWVNAGPNGDVLENWKETLDKHKLIWVGANNSGNPRAMLIRMGLAFDAAAGMKKKYKIDDQRIYVAGFSGGSKIATVLGVAYPEVFRGGIYCCGSDFYRNLPTGEPGHYWPKGFNAPPGKLLIDSKKQNRHVFVTGEKDMNRESTQGFAAAYKADGFEHITLFDIPKMRHQPPDADWFEKGVIALDEIPPPTTKPAMKPATKPGAATRSAKPKLP